MEEKKLRPKYDVQRIGPRGNLIGSRMESTDPEDIDSPFVLMPRKDPAAFHAMMAYAQVCEPVLAAEIRVWLGKIADVEPEYGTQGLCNYVHMKHRQIELFS